MVGTMFEDQVTKETFLLSDKREVSDSSCVVEEEIGFPVLYGAIRVSIRGCVEREMVKFWEKIVD